MVEEPFKLLIMDRCPVRQQACYRLWFIQNQPSCVVPRPHTHCLNSLNMRRWLHLKRRVRPQTSIVCGHVSTQYANRSITANLRVDFCGRGELADRQQKLGQLMSALKKIAEQFNVAIVITNQACAAT